MKKLLVLVLPITMILPAHMTAQAEKSYEQIAAETTKICKDLGLIVGSGEGLTDSYLKSTPRSRL